MEQKILDYIRRNQMIKAKELLLLGVSGGADSLALLHFLYKKQEVLQCQIGVAHLHHGMRGVIADEDMAFVKGFCKERDIPYHGKLVDVIALAKSSGIGVEEAGRKARYDFFQELMIEFGYHKIVTAHHANDQGETLLLRLIRGTGIKGAGGIRPVGDNRIRPLLEVGRKEIEAYCERYKLNYRWDNTNEDLEYSRNYIRAEIMPKLEKLNPKTVNHLVEFTQRARDYETFLQDYVQTKMGKWITWEGEILKLVIEDWINEQELVKQEIIRSAILKAIGTLKDVETKHVNEILRQLTEGKAQWILNLPNEIVIKRRYDQLWIQKGEANKVFEEEYTITAGKTIYLTKQRLKIVSERIDGNDIKNTQNRKIFNEIFVDCGKMKTNLVIRSRRVGDKIRLSGGQGHKSLKKWMIDQKIPKEMRNTLPLIVDGHIVVAIFHYYFNLDYVPNKETKNICKIGIGELSDTSRN